MTQKITFANEQDFWDGILRCVQRGLTFTADGSEWTIVLLGGY